MTMKIEIDENDFAKVMTDEEQKKVFGSVRVLGNDATPRKVESLLQDLLPQAIVEKIRQLTPPNFELEEITIDAEVSGKILGSGVSGTLSMKLTRQPTR